MTRPFKMLILGLVVALLTGCASYAWYKPGITQQDFARDTYLCERDMRQSGYFGTGIAGAINQQNFFDRCMNANGYTKQVQN
jgi:hypothetical protein